MIEKELTVKDIIRGAKGIIKYGLNIDESSEYIKKYRTDTCLECNYLNDQKNKCRLCGCKLKYKIAISSEKCPIGKW